MQGNFRLPKEWLEALLLAPKQRMEWTQGAYRLELRLVGTVSSTQDEPEPATTNPSLKTIRSLEEFLPEDLSTPAPTDEKEDLASLEISIEMDAFELEDVPAKKAVSSASALESEGEMGARDSLKPVDSPQAALSSSAREQEGSGSFEPLPPAVPSREKSGSFEPLPHPGQGREKSGSFRPLPRSSSEPSGDSLPPLHKVSSPPDKRTSTLELQLIRDSDTFEVFTGEVVDTSSPTDYPPAVPGKEKEPFGNETLAPAWVGQSRLLRTSDTPLVLEILFKRKGIPIEEAHFLAEHDAGGISALAFFRQEKITAILSAPVPMTQQVGDSPDFRLVGRRSDGAYVLLYKNEEGLLRFSPVPEKGGTIQIALLEGEELLTDEELSYIFRVNTRQATPEEADATARKIQEILRSSKVPTPQRQVSMSRIPAPSSSANQEKAVAVDERFLNRLEYNRSRDAQLWDDKIQPGVQILRRSLATLIDQNNQSIEGVLLFIVSRNQYLVFDRRSKRYAALRPDAEQRIWIRRKEE